MFTGDNSGDWLAKILYKNGFSTTPKSVSKEDDFKLINTYITATIRCAPPKNRPSKEELCNCATYLNEELTILKNVRLIICLGRISFGSCCKLLGIKGIEFSHGKIIHHQNYIILLSYHPSKQNTQTGRLTWKEWSRIFSKARKIIRVFV